MDGPKTHLTCDLLELLARHDASLRKVTFSNVVVVSGFSGVAFPWIFTWGVAGIVNVTRRVEQEIHGDGKCD